MRHEIDKIIGFRNGNVLISTTNVEELKGFDFDCLIVFENGYPDGKKL